MIKEFDSKIKYNEDELPSFETYENLVDVKCSECGKLLSKDEILGHRYGGITDPKEMLCQGCWSKQAYGD